MALQVNWMTKVITVPQADLIHLGGQIYQLDADVFRLELKEIESSAEGMSFDTTHNHNTTVTVGGAILARVVEIINGYTVTFEDGQYRVNIVGANTNIGDVTNVNQVSVSTSNSAGLQDLNSLQAASFQGGVTIDTTSSFTGTIFPVGTRSNPVNNTADAIAIAQERGLKVLNVASPLTLTSQDFSDGFTFQGDNAITSSVTIETGANVQNCEFRDCTISGVIDNNNLMRDCIIQNVTHLNGIIFRSSLNGTITIDGGLQATLLDCFSGIAGGGVGQHPNIDMNGSGQSLAIRGYSGGLGIRNMTGVGGDVSIDMASGRVVIDSTVTGGEMTIRGLGDVEDSSSGATITNKLVSGEDLQFVKDVAEADEEMTATTAVKKHKDTKAVLVSKTVSGGNIASPPITISE